MPALNSRKSYLPNTYYHVYNRGVNKQHIFFNDSDYRLYLSLLDRYLTVQNKDKRNGYQYPCYKDKIEVSAYCLMPNHFHLLLKTGKRGEDLADFMQSLLTSFTIHMNMRYGRSGHLLQGRYRAVMQQNQSQFLHISRYIHNNPKNIAEIEKYEYSSYRYYLYDHPNRPEWLMSQNILSLFTLRGKISKAEYKAFVADYM